MRILAALVLILTLGLSPELTPAATPQGCGTPAATADGWAVAAPATEGLDPRLICAIGTTLQKMRATDPDGVVMVRHGKLVYEHYFVSGVEYGADTLHGMASITKSVVALLVGIAVDRGWLKSLDVPVFSFFPEDADLRTPDKDHITLRDLLTMTSGLDWPEHAISYFNHSNIVWQMDNAANPYRFVLGRPLAATPGTVWNYNSGGVELIGRILEKVSHEPLDELAKGALLDPLGIGAWEWARADNDRLAASWGLYLRPRDLAKIGQLVLDHGVWRGHQVVSAQCIAAMTARQIPRSWTIGGWAGSYGYLWWRDRLETEKGDVAWVGGLGYGGQRLFVMPSLDMVVAVTAGAYQPDGPQSVAGDTALAIALRAATGG